MRLVLGQTGDALATQNIFLTGTFFLILVADVLEAAGAWVARRRIHGVGGWYHCFLMLG